MDIKDLSKKDLEDCMNSLVSSFDRELMGKSKEQLEEYWYFRCDFQETPESNLYEFYDLLSLYGEQIRRWEEKKNGMCCVVERVRDEYLWPKIKQFRSDFQKHVAGDDQ